MNAEQGISNDEFRSNSIVLHCSIEVKSAPCLNGRFRALLVETSALIGRLV